MNAPDFRVSSTLPRHRKFKRLKHLVGPLAMEYLIRLWAETAEQCPTGELQDWDAEDIAIAAGYAGEPQELVDALTESRFLENGGMWFRWHDWEEHQRWLIKAPDRKEKSKKAADKRWEKNSDECP